MARASKKKIMYSRFVEGCFAEFLGEPDEKGVQAARITDPSVNEGVPFVGLTRAHEWSATPTVAPPAGLPSFVNVIVWQDNQGLHMDVDTNEDPNMKDWPLALGAFRCMVPSRLSQLS